MRCGVAMETTLVGGSGGGRLSVGALTKRVMRRIGTTCAVSNSSFISAVSVRLEAIGSISSVGSARRILRVISRSVLAGASGDMIVTRACGGDLSIGVKAGTISGVLGGSSGQAFTRRLNRSKKLKRAVGIRGLVARGGIVRSFSKSCLGTARLGHSRVRAIQSGCVRGGLGERVPG